MADPVAPEFLNDPRLTALSGALSNISLPLQLLFSFGLGTGARPALEPFVQSITNDVWTTNAVVPPDAILLSQGVAQGQVPYAEAAQWAKETGFDKAQFDAMVNIANVGPGSGYAFELWRRDRIDERGFRRALRRLGWEQEWIDDATHLKDIRLSAEALAVMIQRSVIPNPDILPNQPPTANSDVPTMPVVDLNVFAEAAAHGVTGDRLKALARIIGLPASPDLAARMHFRGIINEDAFNQAIKEGNTRGEWAPFLLRGFREILTAGQYAELQLRGYYDRATRLANTAKHGMSEDDSDLLYDVQGRGLSLHSAFIAERRGGVFEGPTDKIPPWAMFQLQRGNLRPEVYNLAWAGRHTYPSPFVVRGLLTDGAITEAQGEKIYLDVGWPQWLATKVANHYAPSGAAKADPHVTKADNQLWTTQHAAYVKDRSDDTFATATLTELGVAADAIPTVLARWKRERAIRRAGLSAAQIKKAYSEAAVNAVTAAPWTRDEAVAALMELGYSSQEAASYLNI